MDFLKRQLFFIVCGLVALAGIGIGVTGHQAMPKVQAEMKTAQDLYTQLDGLRSKPVNKSFVDAEQERIRLSEADREEVFSKAKALHKYTPLVPGFFPVCDDLSLENRFRQEYWAKLNSELDRLQWNTLAGEFEVEAMRVVIQKELRDASLEHYGADEGADLPPVKLGEEGPAYSKGMVLTRAGAQFDEYARAHMNRAQEIRCYASPLDSSSKSGNPPSLEVVEGVRMGDSDVPPTTDDLWRAQLGVWIQGDVIDAIVSLNDEAAVAFRESQADMDSDEKRPPWVGVMPVKELISVRLSDYVVDESYLSSVEVNDAGGYAAAEPDGTADFSFAGSHCNDLYDVIQFSVKMVMDQRDIPKFIERMCSNSPHILLRVAYRSVPVNRHMQGKIYGEEPAVFVVMDFETAMLREVFLPLMPDTVKGDTLGLEVEYEGD